MAFFLPVAGSRPEIAGPFKIKFFSQLKPARPELTATGSRARAEPEPSSGKKQFGRNLKRSFEKIFGNLKTIWKFLMKKSLTAENDILKNLIDLNRFRATIKNGDDRNTGYFKIKSDLNFKRLESKRSARKPGALFGVRKERARQSGARFSDFSATALNRVFFFRAVAGRPGKERGGGRA